MAVLTKSKKSKGDYGEASLSERLLYFLLIILSLSSPALHSVMSGGLSATSKPFIPRSLSHSSADDVTYAEMAAADIPMLRYRWFKQYLNLCDQAFRKYIGPFTKQDAADRSRCAQLEHELRVTLPSDRELYYQSIVKRWTAQQ